MPLTRVDNPGFEDLDGVRFPMADDNGAIVPVLVTREALQDIQSPPPGEGEFMARFADHRDEFEAIASQMFDAGQFDTIVRIDSADVV